METEMISRLLLAMVFGGAIGYVRELTKKAAGLRTHTLVCLGSAIFTLVSIYMVKGVPGADPSRIAASVVTGIGFIGAGTIFQTGASVRGLTTAASIWVCAAIGLAVGAGLYELATFATILSLIVIQLLQVFEKKFLRESQREGE
jgi:putative Mg2+ transporter-C (MgtC) family protein